MICVVSKVEREVQNNNRKQLKGESYFDCHTKQQQYSCTGRQSKDATITKLIIIMMMIAWTKDKELINLTYD